MKEFQFFQSTCSARPAFAMVHNQHPLVSYWFNEQVVSYSVALLEVQLSKNTFRFSSVCKKVKQGSGRKLNAGTKTEGGNAGLIRTTEKENK